MFYSFPVYGNLKIDKKPYVRTCCVIGCQDKKSKRYSFTSRTETRNIWLERINNEKLLNLSYRALGAYRVCGIHFEDVCKEPNGKLRIGALPTLHLPEYKKVENDNFLPEPEVKYSIVNGSNEYPVNKLRPEEDGRMIKKVYGKKRFFSQSRENYEEYGVNNFEGESILEDQKSPSLKFNCENNAENFLSDSIQLIKEELEETDQIANCRTCLNTISSNDSTMFTDRQREMISKCIPQMEIVNSDHICGICSKNLEISYHFIMQCQEVENKLKTDTAVIKEEYEPTCENYIEETELTLVKTEQNEDLKSKPILNPEENRYKLNQIRAGLPKLNIVVPSTEQDNFKVATNTEGFMLKNHLNIILSMPHVKNFPLPETHFDLSSLQKPKKRILLLGINANKIVSCDDCLKELSNPTQMEKHKNRCWKYILKCRICNKRFFDKNELKIHKANHKRYRCTKCLKIFVDTDKFATHKRECNVNLECCGLKYKSKSSYFRHRRIHNRKSEKYLCDICGKSCKNSGSLSAHRKIHTATSVTCPVCKKELKNKMSYRNHIRFAHRTNINSKCQLCGKVLCTPYVLRRHMNMHKKNSDKKYKCEFCCKQFRSKPSLYNHNRLKHADQDRKYRCDKCDKKFSRSEVKRHKAQHMRENSPTTHPSNSTEDI